MNVLPFGLRVSGEELTGLACPLLGALEVTVENTSSDWVHVNRTLLHFPDDPTEAELRVPWGAELEACHEAIPRRNRLRQTNADLALGVVALGVVALAGLVVADSASTRGSRGSLNEALGGTLRLERAC